MQHCGLIFLQVDLLVMCITGVLGPNVNKYTRFILLSIRLPLSNHPQHHGYGLCSSALPSTMYQFHIFIGSAALHLALWCSDAFFIPAPLGVSYRNRTG
jgi:hypothetical protein